MTVSIKAKRTKEKLTTTKKYILSRADKTRWKVTLIVLGKKNYFFSYEA
jgi:hypothetical protein